MDRRRFVPAPEGLEVRTMLATTGSSFSLLGSGTTTQTLPITFAQKELRIQKMPTNLRALQPDRFLPPGRIRSQNSASVATAGAGHNHCAGA